MKKLLLVSKDLEKAIKEKANSRRKYIRIANAHSCFVLLVKQLLCFVVSCRASAARIHFLASPYKDEQHHVGGVGSALKKDQRNKKKNLATVRRGDARVVNNNATV